MPGMDAYVSKAIRRAELVQAIAKVTEKSNTRVTASEK